MASFYKLPVKTIERLTNKSISITFTVPDNLKEAFAFKAGQYITLKTIIDGNEVRRDYSLCSSPKSGQLTVAIKEVKGGVFSSYANNKLKEGTILEVALPKGRFIFEPNDSKTKNIALFAAGSGITPILSILKCVLEEEVHCKIILVYGNKNTEETMFLNQLLELQQQYKERFSIQFVFSQQAGEDAIYGRIEKNTVNYIIKNKHKDLVVDAFYICGPEAMIHTVKTVLTEHHINDSKIHFELFKASKIEDSEKLDTVSNGKTKITVTVDDDTTTFEMSQKQTILEAVLDENIDAPYSCQGGVCSSCLAQIKTGEATMRQNTILTKEEVEKGFILTCQAHPKTPTITIDFDAV